MKELIRQAIHNYPIFKNEVEMLQQHLEARDDAKVRESLALRLSQIGIIESWFALLSADERIVLRQMIADDNEIAKQSIVWTKCMQQIIGRNLSTENSGYGNRENNAFCEDGDSPYDLSNFLSALPTPFARINCTNQSTILPLC